MSSPAYASAVAPASHARHGTPTARQLPQAGDNPADFGGYVFTAVEEAPAGAGLFILTRRIGAHLYPLHAGEGEDMAAALAAFRTENAKDAALADGLFVLERPQARVRAHTLRDIIGKFDPPLNTEHRKGPAAPEIAALVADRAEGIVGAGEQLAAEMHVTEADLEQLVKTFYSKASGDPLLGPVFARAIPDWEGHYQIVQNFWSRALLGTSRYSGMPFAAHIPLQLKPEHFTRWVALFKETADAVLEPVAAARAIAKVEHMSVCFQAGLFPPEAPAATPHAHPHAHKA